MMWIYTSTERYINWNAWFKIPRSRGKIGCSIVLFGKDIIEVTTKEYGSSFNVHQKSLWGVSNTSNSYEIWITSWFIFVVFWRQLYTLQDCYRGTLP